MGVPDPSHCNQTDPDMALVLRRVGLSSFSDSRIIIAAWLPTCHHGRMSRKAERAKETCGLCNSNLSSPGGEHVLTRALTREFFPKSKGSYTTTSRNGVVVRPHFDSVILACCPGCNDILEKRFETPGGKAARRLLSEPEPKLTPSETVHAVLWILKTWLLLAHPRTEFQTVPPVSPRAQGLPELYSWLISDQLPPAGLSAWAFRHRQDSDSLIVGVLAHVSVGVRPDVSVMAWS